MSSPTRSAARSDAVRDLLTERLQNFEGIFTRSGGELAERIAHNSQMLGELITRQLTEFDRT